MFEKILHIACLCLMLASVETLHGIARNTLLAPRIGRETAQKLSIVSGSALAFLICWWLVPSLMINDVGMLLVVGMILAAFMSAFDIMLARYLLKRPWPKVFADFDPRSGNYLLFGVIFLIFLPFIVQRM